MHITNQTNMACTEHGSEPIKPLNVDKASFKHSGFVFNQPNSNLYIKIKCHAHITDFFPPTYPAKKKWRPEAAL